MVVIKSAENEDAERLLDVKPGLTREVIEQRLNKQAWGRAVWLTAWADEDMVGYVFLKWQGKLTHPEYPDFEDLVVKPEMRNEGVARKLVDEGEKIARRKGFTKIGMAVNPDENDWVYAWYKRLGYQHDGKPAYVDGVYNGTEDWCIDMEKGL